MKKLLSFITSIGIFLTSCVKAETKSDVIILLGPPGAGKGTHASRLSTTLKLPHISTGDLFRENLSKNTSLGEKAKSYMEKGQLVPDELVLDMLFDRLKSNDCKKGYILDGFPRTIEQATSFEKRLSKNTKLIVINLDIEDKPLVDRITNRVICKSCNAPFHKIYLPPKKDGICDYCQGELYQRKDDSEDVVKERLRVYHKQTQPLIDYYKNKKIDFYNINADRDKDDIFTDILKAAKQ